MCNMLNMVVTYINTSGTLKSVQLLNSLLPLLNLIYDHAARTKPKALFTHTDRIIFHSDR